LAVVLLVAGCAGGPHPASDIPSGRQVYKDKVVYFGRDYLISPGDELEIIYHVDVALQDEYRLAIGDQIRLEFYHYPHMDRTLDVRPDGKITVPYKGDILAAGLTPMELARRVNEAYSDFLKHSQSTVTLIRYGQRIRELKDAIKTAPRGQSRLAVVQPDGKIGLPLIPPIMVAGKSIDHAEREINRAYEKIIPGMFTSASLLAANGNVFYIFGAVNKPGFYTLKGPTTVLQGIAIAGGFAPSAETANTLLITRDEENRAVGRLINQAEVISTGNLATDTLLRQADVVFVPDTQISRQALMGDAIRRMIPIDLGVFYNFTHQVRPRP
jgi:polysaccharide export outer membrane protein